MKLNSKALVRARGTWLIILWAVTFVSVLLGGCSTGPSVQETQPRQMITPPAPPPPEFPPGVDSTVALKADSISRELFVPPLQQEMALQRVEKGEKEWTKSDTLLRALSALSDSSSYDTLSVSDEDSLKGIDEYNKAANHLTAAQSLMNSAEDREIVKQKVHEHLDSARFHFEEAIILNPFDMDSRGWLARVYRNLGDHFAGGGHNEKAVEVLENLLQLDRGRHDLYATLGRLYLQLGELQKSYDHFSMAEEVLIETALFEVPEDAGLDSAAIASAIDSTTLYSYVTYQAEVNIRMRRADPAVEDLHRALAIAKEPSQREDVMHSLNWVQWDEGNIRASEVRDSISLMADNAEYEAAASGYLDLLPQLQTDRARREVEHALAVIEYQHLNREEEVLPRMRRVVAECEQSSVSSSDTLCGRYYSTFGTMCFNQGLKAISEKQYRRGLTYFTQAAEIPWKERAKSYVEIAKLSVNRPNEAIRVAKLALAEREQLSRDEELQVLQVLVQALKRTRNISEAQEYYYEYRRMKSQGGPDS